MRIVVAALAWSALATWLWLLLARGGFWRCAQRDDRSPPASDPSHWPAVVAVVPARNEADLVPDSLASLLGQDYPGPLSVVLVDDDSDDDTAARARRAGAAAARPLAIVRGAPLAPGWTGKLWALDQGIRVAEAAATTGAPEFLLLTDADIRYAPGALRALVARAEAGGLALASLMVKLRCASGAERALIPAFVFFFQMLYPFAWVGRTERRTAAAAGGCMLVRRRALAAAGGIGSIRGALIDDGALAARLKRHGPIWLGLTERVESLRRYPSFGSIRQMVARSAYAQLRYSPWLLAATIAGLALAYLAPPALALFGSGAERWIGAATWLLMAIAFVPTLRLYGLSPIRAPLLPAIAAAYAGFTLDSAAAQARGRGGMWKGRAQALASRGD